MKVFTQLIQAGSFSANWFVSLVTFSSLSRDHDFKLVCTTLGPNCNISVAFQKGSGWI